MQYSTTHPWLKFMIDLRNAAPGLWMNLGEISSKCEHVAGVPLRPDTAQRLHEVYLAKGALATTAIEGNTLTEEEVRQHLRGKLKLPPSKEYLKQEVENIISACNETSQKLINGGDATISKGLIKSLNASVLNKLPLEEDVLPGEIRSYSVSVGPYLAPPYYECDHLLDELCKWVESDVFRPPSDKEVITFAVIKAIVFHIYLAWIHPFGDGNGRTARLIEFQILMSAGIPTPACHLLSNHYNQTRRNYYSELDRASKSGGDILPFIEYAVQGLVDGLREQLLVIKNMQLSVTWINYIHSNFSGDKSAAALRQRDVAIELSRADDVVPLNKIPELNTRLAKAYADKTIRTVQRDIEELAKRGLVDRAPAGIRAKSEQILAFLPDKAKCNKLQQAQLSLS